MNNAEYADKVVQACSGHHKTLVICGAGPSLRDHADDYCMGQYDHVWGCNSAATWLYDNGYKVTHAMTVDQQSHMIEEWYSAPDIEYLLASTVHPHLSKYLKDMGRSLTYFHNFVGVEGPDVAICECGHFSENHGPNGCLQCECRDLDESVMSYEHWLYSLFYDSTVVCGAGLNTATRAIDLAGFMGYDEIKVLGADCAIRLKRPKPNVPFGTPEYMKWLEEGTEMHADGGSAVASEATPVTLTGTIDGRHWETKPDLIISAVWLVKMTQAIKQLELVGDTLPNALMDKDDDFLFHRLPNLQGADGLVRTFDVSAHDYNFREP